jgi:hypothetical protein
MTLIKISKCNDCLYKRTYKKRQFCIETNKEVKKKDILSMPEIKVFIEVCSKWQKFDYI